MKKIQILLLSIIFPLFPSMSQELSVADTIRKDAVKIFIDCNHCDMDYIRDEIPYVNYVRDVREAQVYILETSEQTGSGGEAYTYTFTGQFEYMGLNDTLVYHSRPDDTFDLVREGRTQILRMGLMRYVARTPLFRMVDIQTDLEYEEREVTDQWNYWVFELDFDPNFEIEESRKETRWETSFSVTRITPKWKMEFDFEHNILKTKYKYDDSTYTRFRRSVRQENIIVKSLTEHWSAGLFFDYVSSTYSNMDASFDIGPAIEYNIFPYSESTRRELRLSYGVGYSYNKYIDTTIYNKTKEHLMMEALSVTYRVQQRWGSVDLSLEASNYLHDFSKNRIELDTRFNIRLFKGLSFSVYGTVARIHDQIALSKVDMDEADILLQLQEQATSYNFDGGIGFTYTFGSIYNNVVNPRFGN